MKQGTAENRVVVFFDLDGVIIRECGIAEQGYGFILQFLDDPEFDRSLVETGQFDKVIIKQKYIDLAQKLRYRVKGKHPVDKIKIFVEILGKQNFDFDPTYISRAQLAFHRSFISRNWPPEKYVVPGALELLQRVSALPNVVVGSCTANTPFQAQWLMDYIGARKYFNFIAGYGDLPNEAISTKADMIRSELKNYPGVKRTVMIGDGVPDV